MNLDKIYLINLENSIDRKLHFLQEIERKKIPLDKIIFFKAINLMNYDPTEKELCLLKNADYIKEYYTLGVMGNHLSHLHILNDIIENNYEKALILQDDVVLKNNFMDNLNDVLNNIPVDSEIISTGLHKNDSYKNYEPFDINGEYEKNYIKENINDFICKLKNINTCSLALIVTLKGAKNFLNHIYTNGISYGTDHEYNKYLMSKNIYYGSNIILCTGTNKFKTLIFRKYNDKEKKRRNFINELFKNFLLL